MQKTKVVILFLFSFLTAVVIVLASLRLYFNDERLAIIYNVNIQGEVFTTLAGETKITPPTLEMTSTAKDGYIFVSYTLNPIDYYFYPILSVNFSHKYKHQTLLLILQHSLSDTPAEYNILYTIDGQANIDLTDILPVGGKLIDVGFAVPNTLIQPFSIDHVTFKLRKLNNYNFLALISSSFKVKNAWEGFAINKHEFSEKSYLISPLLLLGAIFILTLLLFLLLTHYHRVKLASAFWLTVVLLWLLIDARYFYEQTKITKHSADLFSGKTREQRDGLIEGKWASIANLIDQQISENQADIYTLTGEFTGYVGPNDDKQKYIDGRLKYYLYPHRVYNRAKKPPQAVWLQGGFYYAEIDGIYKTFNAGENGIGSLQVDAKTQVSARNIFDQDGLRLYYIVGEAK